tara:strand:+ start:45875 stop:46468 length:594 start_codon:yes stop_codon:yes gene_type:complete
MADGVRVQRDPLYGGANLSELVTNELRDRNVSDIGTNILSFIGVDQKQLTFSKYPIEVLNFYQYDTWEERDVVFALGEQGLEETLEGRHSTAFIFDNAAIIALQVKRGGGDERRMSAITSLERGINEKRTQLIREAQQEIQDRQEVISKRELLFAAANRRLIANLQAPMPSEAYYDDSDTSVLDDIIGPANTEVIDI